MIPFPSLSPTAFVVFGWPVRWYGLAYLVGIVGGWRYCRSLLRFFPKLKAGDLDDLVPWVVCGVVLGGRLGYILLYDPSYYWAHPGAILQVWKGGMAFHGGLIGVVVSFALYCWKRHLPLQQMADCVACGVPIALFTGRLGNFINQEVYGRPTEMPWGMVFPNVDALPRHPSQLYEAFAEGIVLFVVLRIALIYFQAAKRPGMLSGIFLLGYGIGRSVCEFFRVPDGLWQWGDWMITTGQVFSAPLIFLGVIFLILSPKASRVTA